LLMIFQSCKIEWPLSIHSLISAWVSVDWSANHEHDRQPPRFDRFASDLADRIRSDRDM
jgi:hypothetical protein